MYFALSLGVAGTLQREQAEVASCSGVGLSLSPAQGRLYDFLHSTFSTLSIKLVRHVSKKRLRKVTPEYCP